MASLADKEYRDLFVSEHISQGLAFQIRALRQEKGWTQAELGQQVEMRQTTISQLEDPDYGRFTLSTLKRLASAFDVALMVRFSSFSELVELTTELSPERHAPPSFSEDAQPNYKTYLSFSTVDASERAASSVPNTAIDFVMAPSPPQNYEGTAIPSPKEPDRVLAA